MTALLRVDDLLRGVGAFAPGRRERTIGPMLTVLVAGGFLFGGVMGAFTGRALQMLYTGIKVPLLLSFSTLVCLPNFFVMNTVLGLRADFPVALRALLTSQATMAVALASFAPLTVLLYLSDDNYARATFANGVLFAGAAWLGQLNLARHYRVLVQRDPRHRLTRRVWGALYPFVAIQSAWVLRPFIGAPSLEVSFLREDPWSNAYVVVANTVWRVVLGH